MGDKVCLTAGVMVAKLYVMLSMSCYRGRAGDVSAKAGMCGMPAMAGAGRSG